MRSPVAEGQPKRRPLKRRRERSPKKPPAVAMIQGVPGMPGVGGLAGLAGERQGWDAAAASLRVFAGVNRSRRRNGRPQAAALGSSPKGRRSEVAAPDVSRRPACGGRAGPLRTAPAHGCVSLTAKRARR